MDNRAEARDFLRSRRARLTPEQAGLPAHRGARRVKGLRREEVAMLAGVSAEYYNRIERGSLAGVSEGVLEAIANTLRLDEAERVHLQDLARSATTGSRPRRTSGRARVRPAVQRILDGMADLPAYVRNGRFDILAVNALGAALLSDLIDAAAAPPNLARYLFLDGRSQSLYADWQTVARDTVASLRIEAGRNPYDRGLTDLVGELSTRSDAFRGWWATHNVRLHNTATKAFHHPVVGDLELAGEALEIPADPGLTIITYTAEPASKSAEALNLLASWAKTKPSASDVR
jgi:transcriptional regulator with XRE-family HTH domain